MSRKLNAWGLAAVLVALVVAVGCGGSQEDAAATAAAEREAALAELQEQKAQLDEARMELEQLQSEVAAGGDEAAETTEDEAVEGEAVEDPEARLSQLEAEVQQQTEDFNSALMTFIGGEEMIEGEEPSDAQKAALRMKSDEDMLIAEEYVVKGGNYPRALEIYRAALMVDPENEELQQALARTEAERYMSEERFAQAEEGMTEAEVREALGTPFHANVRTFPDEGVTAWFYPTAPGGSAAAVWFRERRGEMTVYKTNYEEVVKEGPTVVGEDGQEDAAEG